ncbi:thiamine biosynthesis protein [Anaeromyxobacter sp. Red801]|uniref:thiamine biosynthesis protein n=1 Tax=Anaeromyxobacter sp. Red801 TaxID=3411632 RepID=UPI003B9FBE2F
MKKQGKAIGLISGGLDSTLALALVRGQGIEVKAVNFYTGFCITETQRRKGGRPDGTVPQNEALRAAADLEVEIEYVDISGPGYFDMLVNPRWGYGANANPCVDCRVFMMRKAKEIMEAEGADFIFTGEVLGQRPKSQRRDTLRIIERESGLDGRLLRPLSARLLPPTVPEQEGIVDRERLLDISGRGRTRQMALAEELGISEWPQPAGGCCYLTDEAFSRKFFDVLDAREARGEPRKLEREDVVLLSTGRHFRLSPRAKLIVGRTEVENALLEHHVEGRARVEARDVLGPVALVEGVPTWEERQLAARIVARYGKGKDAGRVVVEWREGDLVETYEVEPEHDEARVEAMRI